jgi:hypothetical protein
MHQIHLKDVHMPRGANLFALTVGEIVCSALALIFFLASWAVGGDEFKESIGGDMSLILLIAAIAGGVLLARFTKPES